MKKEQLIETLKTHYPRHIREQLIKTILLYEKNNDKENLTQQYKIINQIFSYVLHESGWNMGENSHSWDSTPLEIMTEVFSQLVTTKWYSEQNIKATSNVDVVIEQ